MLTYFDYRTFYRVFIKTFSSHINHKSRLPPRRLAFLFMFFLIFPITLIFNAIFFKLDDIFFPKYKDIEIDQPVFIVGNPRSGTTYLHRLLSLDENRFFNFKTWEIIFPAIIQKKFISLLIRLDAMTGSHIYRLIIKLEKRFFQDFNRMHPIGLMLPEECEFLLVHIFSAYNLLFLFPHIEVFENYLLNFDESVSADNKKRIMLFYRECIKRQTYFRGINKQFLAKNPGFTCKIDSLLQFFPGCRIIYITRSPLQVVPSVLSLITAIFKKTTDSALDDDLIKKTYLMIKNYYQYPLKRLQSEASNAYSIVTYNQLVASSYQFILSIYNHFGYNLDAAYETDLCIIDKNSKSYFSNHVYSLGQFNLTSDQIYSEYKDVFDRFDFEKT